jgi:hypothetical protein
LWSASLSELEAVRAGGSPSWKLKVRGERKKVKGTKIKDKGS